MGIRSGELVHTGGMRFEARTGTGRSFVFGDRPEANELSPVETLTNALAACSAMDVISILEKKRQKVESYRILVRAEQRDVYPQVLTSVDVIHELEGPGISVAAVRRAIELSATKYCPINAMLSAGATEVHHRYVVRDPRAPTNGGATTEATGEVVVTGPYRRPDPLSD